MFITFEGGEGTGKSTQAELLKDFLVKNGKDVILTREPGGTPLAEEIRQILLTGKPGKMDAMTEALMYLAARADHWVRKIKPALDAGKVVICDRFHDSSLVYQGVCKGVDVGLLNAICNGITHERVPDRTYLMDLAPETGIARSLSRRNLETRFEKMNVAFHKKVRQAFLDLAHQYPARYFIIDGILSVREIQEKIKEDAKKFI